jgi:predicted metal-dependent hydrolase
MASRQIELPEIGRVVLVKRKGARNLRLSVDHNGQLRVSLPYWAPYQAGIDFVKSKSEWIIEKQRVTKPRFVSGQRIGKAHHLHLIADPNTQKIYTRLQAAEAVVRYPATLSTNHPGVQQAAKNISLKVLRSQAERLLPIRLAQLSKNHGLPYNDVRIRLLKSRWGSCSPNKDITLNLFLVQLPWPLIDYVLLHELVHTKVMRHGPPFWEELNRYLPDAKALRREISAHQPNFNNVS